MKSGTIPYPRQFGPAAKGIDCRAVKNALAHALHGPQGMSLKTTTFGVAGQKALAEFKQAHGLLDDPIYTPQAHAALRPHFSTDGAATMSKAAESIAATTQRRDLHAVLAWMLAHRGQFVYEEIRPIPINLAPFTGQTIRTDCSGSIELAAKWADVPDPSKLGYSGAGNTGTLLAACQHIPSAYARPGDLIVYRAGEGDRYGHHAVAILELLPHDFLVFSNGHSGDPQEIRHSVMAASQARSGYGTSTFLRFLPVPTATFVPAV